MDEVRAAAERAAQFTAVTAAGTVALLRSRDLSTGKLAGAVMLREISAVPALGRLGAG